MIGDLLCDQRVLLASGNLIDREICDPVQGDTMMIDLGDGGKPLSMSNWVTQQWFNKNARHEAKLDALGLCTKPLMIRPGGYAIQVDPGGNIHQLGEGPAAYKRNPSFRHGRRLSNAFSYGFKVRHRAHPLRSSVGPPDRDLR
jgi:hypothetical protein